MADGTLQCMKRVVSQAKSGPIQDQGVPIAPGTSEVMPRGVIGVAGGDIKAGKPLEPGEE